MARGAWRVCEAALSDCEPSSGYRGWRWLIERLPALAPARRCSLPLVLLAANVSGRLSRSWWGRKSRERGLRVLVAWLVERRSVYAFPINVIFLVVFVMGGHRAGPF